MGIDKMRRFVGRLKDRNFSADAQCQHNKNDQHKHFCRWQLP